jgi:hypothetical protein
MRCVPGTGGVDSAHAWPGPWEHNGGQESCKPSSPGSMLGRETDTRHQESGMGSAQKPEEGVACVKPLRLKRNVLEYWS